MAEEEKKVQKLKSTKDEFGPAIDEVLRTEAGRKMWGFLFHLCGYNASSLIRKPDGEVAVLSTECREAQRLVYIRFRGIASPELLNAAEQLAEAPIAVQSKEEERK